jgi:hypothetical protein
MTARVSALARNLDGVEVVVVDDGSGDATPELPRDGRSAGAPAEPAPGTARRATPAALARGEYVAWIDADDELLPGAHWRRA